MAYYNYTGRDLKGRKRHGGISAETRQEAAKLLREQGIAALELVEGKPSLMSKDISFGKRVKSSDLVIFLRQFATLVKAGVTIVDAIHILSEQSENKVLRETLMNIGHELQKGQSLSAACEHHRKIFPPLVINMIKAGEAGGQLDETLERLASFTEKQHELKQKVTSTMFYPATVGLMAIAVILFILVYVVPMFANMFEDFNAEIPPLTLFVLNASHFITHMWWIFLLLVLIIVTVFYFLLQNKSSKIVLDYAILKLPIFGKLSQKAEIARIMRTLSSLFTSSVPILQSLSIVERISKNEVIKKVLRDSKDSLENGQSLAEPLSRSWVFPPLVHHMIAIGEKSGSLDYMLEKVADFYEAEVEHVTERLKSLIEPVMIVVLAAVVGFIVLSIVVPMFNLYNQVG
ncbi:type IV pilus assembly protein PilC [Pullulanibacillus pueri]|uniref:Secretion system protein n=1 Tax=Pullulanibacillus pueri TaxID=1437324 RepID=A0A8J3EP29_9BACL|nr:type II secretion system F family protein [Pullulanibacillus pueri]MBM7680508.1 type IV pilus assembly protein PilC [Pullulanibacillus pueri]GGH86064.1 secretion system protein [Pullulanibacillus pueri]